MLKIVNYKEDEYNFPALVVLGCFDGIHIGHAELLKKAKLQAKINGLDLGVMMFSEGKGDRQLYSFEERCAFLEKYNVKFILKIDFTDEFKKTTPAQFLETVEKFVNVKGYMSGKDFRFGAGAKGKSATLKKYADDEDNGVWYTPIKDVLYQGEKVSATLIKKCLEEGAISKANELLGRKYTVSGKVESGNERGTEMGIPTANIVYPANKALIKQGVYGVEVEFGGNTYKGAANFGARPTFGEDSPVLETYILDYDGDLYGQEITISFINYIRGIREFADADALCAQIKTDLTHIGEPDSTAEDEPLNISELTAQPAAEPVEDVAEPAVAEEVAEEPVAEVAAEEHVVEVAESVAEEEVSTEVATEEVAAEPEAEEVAEPVEEVVEEPALVAEEIPAEEVTEEVVTEEIAEETVTEAVTEEATEEAAEEITEEAAAEPVAETVEEIAEEPAVVTEETAEEVAEEATEEPVKEVAEPEAETVAEEVTEEVAETTEEAADEPVEEAVEELVTEEPEEITEETAEEVAEESAEDAVETPVEEAAEEAAEPAEEPAPAAEPEKELTPEELAELEFEREFALLLEEEARENELKAQNGGKND